MNREYAVITGSSQGIGKAIATELAKRNLNIILVALPDSGLDKVARDIRRTANIDIQYYEGDLTENPEREKFCKWLEHKNFNLKVWVNNAGRGYEGPALEHHPVFFEKLLMLNVGALAMLSLWYVNYLKSQGKKGYLMNLGSIASFYSLPNKTFYSASKSFVLGFSRSLRAELKIDDISVSCLCPGPVSTNQSVSERIKDAGLLAKFFTVTPEKLAVIAVNGLFRKKAVIVPSLGNKLLRIISNLVPHSVIIFFTTGIFKVKQKVKLPSIPKTKIDNYNSSLE